MAAQTWQTDADDVRVLRELARRYVDITASPALLSTDRFDEDTIRSDIRQTLATDLEHG